MARSRSFVCKALCATILPRLGARDCPTRPLEPPLWRELAVALRADKRRDRGLRQFMHHLCEATASGSSGGAELGC